MSVAAVARDVGNAVDKVRVPHLRVATRELPGVATGSILGYDPTGVIRMLKPKIFQIATIHVPVKRAKSLDRYKVGQIAEGILEDGQTVPIQVRADAERFVLVEGLHRIEAMKALGESTINGYLVQPRQR
ncbi:ParB N-terminal domain-containing protein [Pararhodobacter sp. SW119]|uniref:ParB N-terminal domain-containing protein n=1 Tax=Pararhodobacter sp. SW119 TaxID=2780075 RepID=UPI0032AFE706